MEFDQAAPNVMACREKKLFAGRKQASLSPIPPKETITSQDTQTKASNLTLTESKNLDNDAPHLTPIKPVTLKVKNTKAATKITKNVGKKAIGKTLTVNLKAKNKKLKIKKQLAKALLNNAKSLDGKKGVLLKNGKVKAKRGRKPKAQIAAESEQYDEPPILEPIVPLKETTIVKRRAKKIKQVEKTIDSILPCNSSELIEQTIDSVISQCTKSGESPKVGRKPRVKKAIKKELLPTATETIEDVIKDLSSLIENNDVKQDLDKTEINKTKKSNKKAGSDPIKRKRNFNNTLDASDAQHLIDVLDLSVQKINQNPMCNNRRHSIEKFPVSVFSNLPRTINAKATRVTRPRQSLDTTSQTKRFNPYSTRSDSSQALRNGKYRKIKDALFEGLDSVSKKRKMLNSDFSGSEKSVSKSGYESDCSFSDKVSTCTSDTIDQKETIKIELLETQNQTNTQDSNVNKSSNNDVNIKSRALSTDYLNKSNLKNENYNTDNNSNLYQDVSSNDLKVEPNEDVILDNCSSKVPEKSIILDIMKQTFNNDVDDQEKRTTRSSIKRTSSTSTTTIKTDEKTTAVSTAKFYGVNEFVVDCKSEETFVPLQEEFVKDENKNGANFDLVQSKSDSGGDSINGDMHISSADFKMDVEETPEEFAIKESILQALGLLTLEAAEEAKRSRLLAAEEAKKKSEDSNKKDKVDDGKSGRASNGDDGKKDKSLKSDYTGTLKTVIKLNRSDRKKGRNPLKITLTKNKNSKPPKEGGELESQGVQDEQKPKTSKDAISTSWRTNTIQSSDTAGALRKSHYSNRSNQLDGSSEDGDATLGEGEEGAAKNLVIPEKASSFSIHPERMCKDECTNCNTKFGIFDTPQHIAQLKAIERQNKILQNELKLTKDSCLCDACYRHIDRKANAPSYSSKGCKRTNLITPRQNYCHVLGCNKPASNILRRKWIIKMRKSICQVINIDLDNPGLHSIPICDEHYLALEYLMVCVMCKRKLARNHIHYLGPETTELTVALNDERIPVTLNDKLAVCKCCRIFATLILKPVEERTKSDTSFFEQYKKRLLHFHEVELMDDLEADEPISVPIKEKCDKEQPIKKKKKYQKSSAPNSPPSLEPQVDLNVKYEQSRVPSESNSTSKSRSESPSDYMVDCNILTPSIAMECGGDEPEVTKQDVQPSVFIKRKQEYTENFKNKVKSDSFNKSSAVQRLGSNPCISVRQLFPGEEELGLQTSLEFNNVKEKTPEGWEKCSSTIQYDPDTKVLWNELQKPYGNQSSFLRHLVLLEKYFRSGDLILSPNASNHSINYSESVQNRLRAYDNVATTVPPQTTLIVKKSTSGIITTKDMQPRQPSVSIMNAANIPKNTPITISQINNLAANGKTRNPGVPPGLISLHPGTSRPSTSLIKVPQPQKIKIPLTKNWRPNLIPIDPSKKSDKRLGHVKVMSNGKPYHITLDDYNRMCAIKKSYDLKQKRLMEAQQNSNPSPSILKAIGPRKGLIISKTATITSPDNSYVDNSMETENSLEKLDKTVENLESKLNDTTSLMNLPKIPKSLTVIPQTITHKALQASSPTLMIVPKPKSLTNNNKS